MIGNVPEGWKLKEFLEVFKDDTAKKKKIPTETYLHIGNIPVIDQGQKAISGYTNDTEALNTYQPIIIFGDHTRALKYIDFDFAIGADGVKVLKNIENKSNTKYLYYALLNNPIPNTGYNRHFKYLKRIQILIPSLPQQEKIVKVLDISSALVEKQRLLMEKYDMFLKSKFIEMFGDPISNPMGWEVVKFDDVFKKITDGTHYSPPMSERGYKYITAKHIKENKIDFKKDETYISEEEHKKIFSRCSPEKGDVLYIKDGATTGIACINSFEEEFSLLSSVALLKPSNKIKAEYVVSYLNNSSVKSNILLNMAGGAIKRLTLKKIKDLNIFITPITLQNKFAQIVEKIELIKEKENKKLTHLQTLHNSLMERAFKGEIK